MLTSCALVAIGMGLIIGRLYPAISLLLVSPLVGVVAGFAASREMWSHWQAALFGLSAIFLFQASFLGGVRLRSSFKRFGAAKPVPSPQASTADGTGARVDR